MPQTFNVGSRSPFVTATAWLFMALALAIACATLASHGSLATGLQELLTGGMRPWLAGLLADHWPWALGAAALLAMGMATGSVGLLLRLEWARRLFLVLLAVVLAAQLAGLWLQHEFVSLLVESTLRSAALPQRAAGVFGGMALAAQILWLLLTLAAAAALMWVMSRLMSDSVRQEFA